jgi:hypothetical protein
MLILKLKILCGVRLLQLESADDCSSHFLSLSAHLAQITSNETYKDAAVLTSNFVVNHLLYSNMLVIDSVTPPPAASASTDCTSSLFTVTVSLR